MGQTYYEILGVAENATPEAIEAAFKSRAREVHPDTVAPENAYLRRVAAEAFKDLSEAKAVLLNPIERQKYDGRLAYQRGAKETSSASTAPPPPAATPRSGSPPPARAVPPASTARASAPAPKRPPRFVFRQPLNASLVSFFFVVLGLGSIFFVGWLMWSGRTPPVWLAILTLCVGLLSFRHGMRPSVNPRVRGASVPLLIVGFVLAAVFFFVWFPSMPVFVPKTTAEHAEASAPDATGAKAKPQPGSSRAIAAKPTIVTVDESGDDVGSPVKIWTNPKDGQSYRTRLNGDTLSLESVGGNPKTAAGIANCEFHRAASGGQSWTGNCSERNRKNQNTRQSSATIRSFSDTRIEVSTSDIPEFAMIPVENASAGAPGSPQSAAEPDLSSLTGPEKQSLESACASDKLMQGPAEYNGCLAKQLAALKALPKRPDLSGLSSPDADFVESQCSGAKLMQGPAAYYQCLSNQLELLKKRNR
jgi:hypothetical protein